MGSDKYERGEFGTDLVFLWEFKSDISSKRIV